MSTFSHGGCRGVLTGSTSSSGPIYALEGQNFGWVKLKPTGDIGLTDVNPSPALLPALFKVMRYMLLPRLKMDDGPSPITILRCIFQRLPGLGILCFLVPVSLIGPFVCPKLFVTYFLFLHLIFLGNALRTVCGMRKAYFLTVESSTTDWRAKYLQSNLHPPPLVTFDSIIHVILIPNYKESVDTLSETLDVLASHEMARTQYRVGLFSCQCSHSETKTCITGLSSDGRRRTELCWKGQIAS